VSSIKYSKKQHKIKDIINIQLIANLGGIIGVLV